MEIPYELSHKSANSKDLIDWSPHIINSSDDWINKVHPQNGLFKVFKTKSSF